MYGRDGTSAMKPNYHEMTDTQLRTYILSHRDDLDAMEAFFARRSPDAEAVWFHPPKIVEEWQQQIVRSASNSRAPRIRRFSITILHQVSGSSIRSSTSCSTTLERRISKAS
jgi:hypothetical protein